MNDQEINIAIAEAIGIKKQFSFQVNNHGRLETRWRDTWEEANESPFKIQGTEPKEELRVGQLPNYCRDLNAMHEAEGILNPRQCETYEAWLMDFNASGGAPCKYYRWHATARQRAEAFLRTIGKWKEGE